MFFTGDNSAFFETEEGRSIAVAFQEALKAKSRARALADEAKAMAAKADKSLKAIMSTYDLGKVQTVLGTLSLSTSDRATLQKDKLVDNLLKAGLSVPLIEDIVKDSTKVASVTTLRFTPPKTP